MSFLFSYSLPPLEKVFFYFFCYLYFNHSIGFYTRCRHRTWRRQTLDRFKIHFFSTGRIFENCFYSVFCCLAFWIEEQGCYLLLGSFAFFDLLSNIRTDTVGTARHRHFRSYYFCCFGNVYCRWGKVATCFGYIICWSSSLGHTLFYKTLHKTED